MAKFPKAVFLQTKNTCNSRCIICPYKDVYASVEPQEMDINLYKKILDDLTPEYDGQIGFYLHYEPLTDSRLQELIDLAKQKCPLCQTWISTNAGLLTHDVRCDVVCLNINGGTKEVYEKQMPPLKWETMIENVTNFLKIHQGRVYINFVKTKDNDGTQQNLKDLFHLEIVDDYWATNRGGSVDVNVDQSSLTRFKNCREFETNLPILHDGTILLCCNCWQGEVVVGDANTDNVLEVFNKQKDHNHDICRRCL